MKGLSRLGIRVGRPLMVCLGFCLAAPVEAQPAAPGSPGRAGLRAVINFSDLARQEKLPPPEQPAGGKAESSLPQSAEPLLSAAGFELAGLSGPLFGMQAQPSAGFTPVLRGSFSGVIDNHATLPPDTHGAVGPEHVMVALNTEVAVQDRQGQTLSKVTLANFWRSMGHQYTFDPKVIYDHWDRRFVVTTLADPGQESSALLVAVSHTTDPTGEWHLFEIAADPEHKEWLDYPNLGYNSQWFVVTVNTVGIKTNDFRRASIFVFDKHDLYEEDEAEFVRFGDSHFTVVPAVSFDPNPSPLYLLTEGSTSRQGIVDRLQISKIEGPLGKKSYVTNVAVTPLVPEWSFSPGTNNFAPQLGSNIKIFSNDSRLQSCVQRQGSLWCAHHIFLPAGTHVTRSAVQWWQINTNGVLLQRGRLDDPSGKNHYTFPSLAVNRLNDVLIGFSSFNSNQYASGSYAFRRAVDPPNTLRPVARLKGGLAPYFRDRGDGRNRWGDFSSTVVDPLNEVDLWTFQEYAEMPDERGDRWGTWWGWVGFQAAVPPAFTAQPQSQSVWLLGTNISLTMTLSGTEPFEFQWRCNGTNVANATNASLVITNFQPEQVGRYSVVASNGAGYASSAAASLTLVPPTISTNPLSQVVRATTHVVLSAAAIGTQPLFYQWRLSGTNLVDATHSTLVISNFTAANEGPYCMVASNVAGTATSAVATLTLKVISPPVLSQYLKKTDGSFVLAVSYDDSAKITLQASTNLVSWSKLITFSIAPGQLISITDPTAKPLPRRYYRATLTLP